LKKKDKIIGMDMIQVKIEFSGLSRILAHANDMLVSIPPDGTYADVVRVIADKYPDLVGNVIDNSRNDLFPSNVFSRDGKITILPDQMNEIPHNGETLILLSLLAGG
jgi:hypothetical protein